MSDNLAERPKNLAREQARGQQAEIDQQSFQERVNTFISDHAREEYDNLIRLLKERAEQLNSQIGELPKFVPGGYFIQQGNMALYFHFDKPIMNRADNALLLSVGPAPNTMYLFGNAPQPVRRKLHAAAADDMSSIVWVSSRLRSYSYPTSATSFALAGLQVTFAW